MTESKLSVSVPEAARMIGLGKSTVWAMIAQGSLPAVRIGARTLVPVRALEQLVDKAA